MSDVALKRSRPDGALRLDPPVALLPLARPRGRNQPRLVREKTITYHGTQIEVTWVELDDREQTLILHLIALAMERGEVVEHQEKWGLRETGKVLSSPRILVRVSAAELMRRAGWISADCQPGEGSYRALRRTLARLHQIVITGKEDDEVTYTTNLIGGDTRTNRKTKSLELVLSARLAVALCGGHHVLVAMSERSQLSTPVARILHLWMSAWLKVGGRQRIGLETLKGHVWPERSTNPAREGKRLSATRKALREIRALSSWDIALYRNARGEEMVSVARCRIERDIAGTAA